MSTAEQPRRTEGEQWTREQLEALLARRFSPPAVVAFLVASQRRASAVRAARPELGRQARRWLAIGALAYLAGGRRRALWWWATVAVMLDWHLGMVESEDGTPRPLGPADALTMARVWLAPLAHEGPSPWIVGLAGATDVLDGRVARAGVPTRIGRDLEGLADTAFFAFALTGAVRGGRLSRTAARAELARLGVGFAYAFAIWFGTAAHPDARVLRAARLTTPVRVAGLAAAGAGRRRLGDALVLAGCGWSVAEVLRAVVRRGG